MLIEVVAQRALENDASLVVLLGVDRRQELLLIDREKPHGRFVGAQGQCVAQRRIGQAIAPELIARLELPLQVVHLVDQRLAAVWVALLE
jgi:hypothetical protein